MEIPTESLRILVIGAGPAGLLCAQVLKQNGISCTVFEQDAWLGSRPRDWNFGVYWAQSPLSECLPSELSTQLESVQVDSHTPSTEDSLPIYNGETGELLNALPAPFNLRLQRRKFVKLISTGIDIRYGKRVTHIHTEGERATATFEDGSAETGNLVIGAEGAHSKVREILVGKEEAALKPSSIVASAVNTRLTKQAALDIRNLHPRYSITLHPNGYFTWQGIHSLNDSENPEDWTFMLIQSWISEAPTGLRSGPDILKDFRKRAQELAEPFRSTFEVISNGTPIWHNRLSYWVTQPWDNRNGTLTLAGDAAHSMTFRQYILPLLFYIQALPDQLFVVWLTISLEDFADRGQGLNNAILDAAQFGKKIAEMKSKTHASLREAVSEYEKEVWARGNEAVLSSNENSLSIHNWAELRESPLFKAGLQQKIPTQ